VVGPEICDCDVQPFGTPSIAKSASANRVYENNVIVKFNSPDQGEFSCKDLGFVTQLQVKQSFEEVTQPCSQAGQRALERGQTVVLVEY
jgi:hypothetical protein